MNQFNEGELIIYKNGEIFEIGKIKKIAEDGAFVYYHDGSTAAKTPYENMHKLVNSYVIKETSLGESSHFPSEPPFNFCGEEPIG